jgi:hypothetical protein
VQFVPSHRCSTHIHVNFQQDTWRTVIGYMLLFTVLEPVLLRLCPKERNGNLFCLPASESGDFSHFMSALVLRINSGYWNNISEWHQTHYRKYSNLCATHIGYFGSLETRCFPVSINPDEILRWVDWLLGMRRIARTWEKEDYSDLFDDPGHLATQVFGNIPLWQAVAPQSVAQLLELGCETAYEGWRVFEEAINVEDRYAAMRKKTVKQSQALINSWG